MVAVARRRERLEALQQALVGQGVPIADFLPIVCDITKVRHASAGQGAVASGVGWQSYGLSTAAANPMLVASRHQNSAQRFVTLI